MLCSVQPESFCLESLAYHVLDATIDKAHRPLGDRDPFICWEQLTLAIMSVLVIPTLLDENVIQVYAHEISHLSRHSLQVT